MFVRQEKSWNPWNCLYLTTGKSLRSKISLAERAGKAGERLCDS